MTGFESKRRATQDKLDDDDDTQVYADTLLIAYQSGFADGKRAAQPEQEPSQWRDMVVVSLVREGINKHKARELADHFATPLAVAQPEQEPVAWAVQGCSKMWRDEFAEIDAKAEAKRIGGTCVAYALYTTPPQRPWVGLTDEDVTRESAMIALKMKLAFHAGMYVAQKILKERNNG